MATKRAKLTKTMIDSFVFRGKTPKSRDLRWDAEVPGFGVRVWPSGAKSFFVVYWHGGRQRNKTLGQYGILTLQQARDMARAAKVKVLQGKDPLAERDRGISKTFGEFAEEYVKRHASKKRSGKDDERDLDKHVLPRWRNRPLASIKRADAAQLHARVSEAAPIRANRVLSLVSKMFNLAKIWGYLPDNYANPTHGIERNKEQARDRFLGTDEMRRLIKAIEADPHLYVRAALWIYLLTGARKSSVLALKWEDVNYADRIVTLRSTKSGKPQPIPLTTHLEQILRQIPRVKDNPHVFVGHRKGSHLADIRGPWNQIRETAKIEDVWIHDLRRTVATWLVNSGHELTLVTKVLDHSSPHVTHKHYARLQLAPVAKALEEHGDRLRSALKVKDDHSPSPESEIDSSPDSAS